VARYQGPTTESGVHCTHSPGFQPSFHTSITETVTVTLLECHRSLYSKDGPGCVPGCVPSLVYKSNFVYVIYGQIVLL